MTRAILAIALLASFAAQAHQQPPPPTPDHTQQTQGQVQGQAQGQSQNSSNTNTNLNIAGGGSATSTATGGNAVGIGGSATSEGSTSSSGGNVFSVNSEAVANLPPAIAPNVYPTAPCIVSNSGAGTGLKFGLSIGISHKDDDCTRRETARTLQALGETQGAVALMCQDANVYRAMKRRCDIAIAALPPVVLAQAPVIVPPAIIQAPVAKATPIVRKPVVRKRRFKGCK